MQSMLNPLHNEQSERLVFSREKHFARPVRFEQLEDEVQRNERLACASRSLDVHAAVALAAFLERLPLVRSELIQGQDAGFEPLSKVRGIRLDSDCSP